MFVSVERVRLWMESLGMVSSERVLSTRFLYLLLLLAGFAVFGKVLDFSFVTSDDWNMIVRYPLVNAWSEQSGWERLITRKHSYAMPLSVASFALDWKLWGERPGMFHATNLLLHLMCVFAFFGLSRRWFGERVAFLVSLVMLLHPIQAEVVGYVSQRKDLMACLFGLIGVYGLSWIVQGSRVGWGIFVLFLGTLLAGLSKPTAMLMGPIFAISWWFVISGELRRKHVWAKLLLFSMGPMFLALNLYVNRLSPHTLRYEHFGVWERLAWVGHTATHYATSLFWPVGLSPRVPMPAPIWTVGAVFGWVVSLLLLWGVLVVAFRRRVWLAVLGGVWIVGVFLPISNFVPISRYVADSYFYLAMPGLLWLVSWWVVRGDSGRSSVSEHEGTVLEQQTLNQRSWGWGIGWLVVVVGLGLGWMSFLQVGHWRNEETLFRYLVQRWPEQKEPLHDLVDLLRKKGAHQEALRLEESYLQRAILARPQSMNARHLLVRLYLREGRPERALAVLLAVPQMLRNNAAYWEARLEWAMQVHRMPAAYRAVQQILRYDPTSSRRAMLPMLRLFLPTSQPATRPFQSTSRSTTRHLDPKNNIPQKRERIIR